VHTVTISEDSRLQVSILTTVKNQISTTHDINDKVISLIRNQAIKAYGRVEIPFHTFKRHTCWTGDWVGTRNNMNALEDTQSRPLLGIKL
jgi:hypothetical protein